MNFVGYIYKLAIILSSIMGLTLVSNQAFAGCRGGNFNTGRDWQPEPAELPVVRSPESIVEDYVQALCAKASKNDDGAYHRCKKEISHPEGIEPNLYSLPLKKCTGFNGGSNINTINCFYSALDWVKYYSPKDLVSFIEKIDSCIDDSIRHEYDSDYKQQASCVKSKFVAENTRPATVGIKKSTKGKKAI